MRDITENTILLNKKTFDLYLVLGISLLNGEDKYVMLLDTGDGEIRTAIVDRDIDLNKANIEILGEL